MSESLVDKIARAVLYEGYVLYPYRPSVKTRQRWTFGGVFPLEWTRSHRFGDSGVMQAQCLITSSSVAGVVDPGPSGVSDAGYRKMGMLSVTLRFLHLTDRIVEQGPDFRPVPSLRIGDRDVQSWQEAVEREVSLEKISISELLTQPRHEAFSFPEHREIEPLDNPDGPTARLLRQQQAIAGEIELSAAAVATDVIRLTVRVTNHTPLSDDATRDSALLHSLASTHLILTVPGGAFISLTDPPAQWADLSGQCQNIGCWPVLAGEANQTDTLLASPIILPDYPQIAPESPGDLFDGCEIDEILTLRIMTLTDEEKRQAAATDDRVAKLLARTQKLARGELMNLHGAMRDVGSISPPLGTPGEGRGGGSLPAVPEPTEDQGRELTWDPLSEKRELEKTLSAGIELRPGDRVRLHPRGSADVFDIALAGRTATIASIEQDFENRIHLAVTIDDDPGSDLGITGKPGHRFFFGPDEVEVLERSAP
jgi:hypothetical protein